MIKNLKESAEFVLSKIKDKPEIAIILGSGLGEFAETLEDKVIVDYQDIPFFPRSTVQGHKGRLVYGKLSGKKILCMQGRVHFYEGYEMRKVVYPIGMFKMMGIDSLIVTNAAGCVNENWKAGDLMLITDHIKLIADNPLRGENLEYGERFFDMSTVYDKDKQRIAKEVATSLNIDLKEGVYMLFTGPSFETPAEIRMARLLGADAVGMSTVPEVIAASHAGIKVMGISCLTNMAAGILNQKLNHIEVLETGALVKDKFEKLLKEVVKKW